MKISVIIPCYNEAITIENVIRDIQNILPESKIYVFDNNSTDNSAKIANDSGVILERVGYQGKGEVVRRAFAILDCDVAIMIDADSQYDTQVLPKMLEYFLDKKLDMLNISRDVIDNEVHRVGHSFGNKMLTGFAKTLFGKQCNDMLSGYRIFSKRFIKTFPSHSKGFEIETELTIFALQMRLAIDEIPANYKSRPVGSFSKLNTFRDGFRILGIIFYLLMTEKPILFWGIISFIFISVGFYLGIDITIEFFETLLVPRMPTAILSIGFILLSGICFITGLIMDNIKRAVNETRWYQYINTK